MSCYTIDNIYRDLKIWRYCFFQYKTSLCDVRLTNIFHYQIHLYCFKKIDQGKLRVNVWYFYTGQTIVYHKYVSSKDRCIKTLVCGRNMILFYYIGSWDTLVLCPLNNSKNLRSYFICQFYHIINVYIIFGTEVSVGEILWLLDLNLPIGII